MNGEEAIACGQIKEKKKSLCLSTSLGTQGTTEIGVRAVNTTDWKCDLWNVFFFCWGRVDLNYLAVY